MASATAGIDGGNRQSSSFQPVNYEPLNASRRQAREVPRLLLSEEIPPQMKNPLVSGFFCEKIGR
ncbi:MAG: hypothetical protein RBT39_12715, partial [Azoarcus sp.]|nr:hypothetical protein [Azoarcus sp.]